MMKRLFIPIFALVFAVPAFARSALVDALDPIQSLTTEEGEVNWTLDATKLRGTHVEAMLRDYAERTQGWSRDGEEAYTFNLRMSPENFPDSENASDGIGLARIVDVAGILISPTNETLRPVEEARRLKVIRKALFAARDLGGLVGVVSSAWSVCGTQFSAVFVLDPKTKMMWIFVPESTEC